MEGTTAIPRFIEIYSRAVSNFAMARYVFEAWANEDRTQVAFERRAIGVTSNCGQTRFILGLHWTLTQGL